MNWPKLLWKDLILPIKNLNEQQKTETDKRIELEAAIATEEAAWKKKKLDFIEKEKALQQQQHAFNELNNTVREKENEKNLKLHNACNI